MSSSSNTTFYNNLHFDSYSDNKPLLSSNSSYPVYDIASTPQSNEHFQYNEVNCTVKREPTYSLSYPVKIEQYPDYPIDNSHFNLSSINDNNSSLVYNFFTENYNFFQQLSPQLSNTDQSPLDTYYGESTHTSFDYFMSTSPTASYSLSPPPTLSPELQAIGISHGDTTENNHNLYNYHYATLEYPSVDTEISTCCSISGDFILPLDDKDDININYINNEENKKSTKSTACSVVTSASCSSGDEMIAPKKIYPCNYCKRSFARKYDVARHKRIHTGSKPYVCPHCLKGFSRSDARVRHFRTEIACRDGADKLSRHKTQKLNSTNMSKR